MQPPKFFKELPKASSGMSGFFRVSAEPAPTGWYRALTISGKPAGLGFQCPKCHLGYRHSAPAEIFHCGKSEKAPRFTHFCESTVWAKAFFRRTLFQSDSRRAA